MGRRSFAVALILSLLLLASGSRADQVVVEVRAERLQVDHLQRTAVFEGGVEATYGTLHLRCERMRVTYGDAGELLSLIAEGGVTVRRGEARATAARARLNAPLGLLVLEGNPVLISGLNRIQGRRIEVDLSGGRISVTEARGTFRIDPGVRR